jgi:acyl-CoA:6-aminopenicillanic acid acyl transferase
MPCRLTRWNTNNWICLALLAAWLLPGCASPDNNSNDYYIESSREEVGDIHLIRLIGTPYEMGKQYGRLVADELVEGVEFLNTDPFFSLFLPLARSQGFIEEAEANSYPEIIEECRGMVKAASLAGVPEWEFDICIGLAYGEVIIEHLAKELGGGCTQLVASGPATKDSGLVHARNMDWGDLSYLLNHPTIIVRQPEGKIPFMVVGFPASVAPYSGMNLAGLAVASNEIDALDDIDRSGSGHQQMMYRMLGECSSLAEAEAFLQAQDHMTAESILISDGNSGEAAVFEMTANHMGISRLSQDGVVYISNHFAHPEMVDLDIPESPDSNSWTRFERLEQLLEPGGPDSLHGQLDVAGAISVLRDNYNPRTQETCPADHFDDCGTIGNSATIYSMIFLPKQRIIYMAEGGLPVPQQHFIGFSLEELLKKEGTQAPYPAVYE